MTKDEEQIQDEMEMLEHAMAKKAQRVKVRFSNAKFIIFNAECINSVLKLTDF